MNRRALFLVGLAVVVVLGAYLASARRTTGPPLDPRSTAPDGARAVVELVGRFAATVPVLEGVPGPDVDTALLLQDRYQRDDADALDAWVRAGGTLVVADPGSPLTPAVTGAVADVVAVDCAGVLAVLGSLDLGLGRSFADDATQGCATAEGALVVSVRDVGGGTVVAVAGPDPFTNRLLDEQDNAALAVALLAPTPDTRAAFLAPRVVAGSGDDGLVDLIGDPVWAALLQLALAFLVVVWWRGRRLGAPVAEPQQVAIDSSELTVAVGRLLEGNRRPDRAAATLRDRARRDLSAPLGLAPDAPASRVVAVLAARTSLDTDQARRAVAAPVSDDAELVVVADLLARIRQEVTHGRPTPSD